jgi:predicted DNA-binding protein
MYDRNNLKQVCFRMPTEEYETLSAFAKKTGRSRTDLLREFVKSLEDKMSEAHLHTTPYDVQTCGRKRKGY